MIELWLFILANVVWAVVCFGLVLWGYFSERDAVFDIEQEYDSLENQHIALIKQWAALSWSHRVLSDKYSRVAQPRINGEFASYDENKRNAQQDKRRASTTSSLV